MKGFIINEGISAQFKLQRQLYPGSRLSFDDAYSVVGKKSGKRKGPTFVKWLKETCLPSPDWVFYKAEGELFFEESEKLNVEVVAVKPGKGAGVTMRRKTELSKQASVGASELVEPDYSSAKELIDNCKSKAVLKKALALTRIKSNREQHMRHLMKRLEQVN